MVKKKEESDRLNSLFFSSLPFFLNFFSRGWLASWYMVLSACLACLRGDICFVIVLFFAALIILNSQREKERMTQSSSFFLLNKARERGNVSLYSSLDEVRSQLSYLSAFCVYLRIVYCTII